MPTRNGSGSSSQSIGSSVTDAKDSNEIIKFLKSALRADRKGEDSSDFSYQTANTFLSRKVDEAFAGAYAEKLKKDFDTDDVYINKLKEGVKEVLREKVNGALRANEKITAESDNYDKNEAIFTVTTNDKRLFSSFKPAEILEEVDFFRFKVAERSVDGGKNKDVITVNPDSFKAVLYPKGRAFLKKAGLLDLWNAKF